MRPVQFFSDEYLEQCKQMTAEQILQFLDDFRLMFAAQVPQANQETDSPNALEPIETQSNTYGNQRKNS